MSPARRTLVRLACVVSLLACNSESNPTAPESAQVFTTAELTSAVSTLGGEVLNLNSLETNLNLPCPRGGSVQVTPVSSTFTEDGIGAAVVQLAHSNCRTVDEQGREWTVSGRPSLRVSISVEEGAADSAAIRMAMRGNLRLSTANRSGDCAIDMLYTVGFQFTEFLSATLHSKGSVCGQPIDETVSLRLE